MSGRFFELEPSGSLDPMADALVELANGLRGGLEPLAEYQPRVVQILDDIATRPFGRAVRDIRDRLDDEIVLSGRELIGFASVVARDAVRNQRLIEHRIEAADGLI